MSKYIAKHYRYVLKYFYKPLFQSQLPFSKLLFSKKKKNKCRQTLVKNRNWRKPINYFKLMRFTEQK